MDQKALRAARYDECHEVARKEGKKEDAKRMLEEDIDIELIIRITGLTKEEIKKLK